MSQEHNLKDLLIAVGTAIAHRVHRSLREQSAEWRSQVFKDGADDTIFQIDRDVEEVMLPLLQAQAQEFGGIHLLAEGVGEDIEGMALGSDHPAWRLIIDPIDGTRGIMYDKRSAFFLAAAAPNQGSSTRLSDATVAVMVELPTSRSQLADVLWAVKGEGLHAYTLNLETGETLALPLQPSKASNLKGGFAQLARFFGPGRDVLARIEDDLIEAVTPDFDPAKAIIFEDQYISTGGQLYQVLVGHDRFIADVRHHLYQHLRRQGKRGGHVCHPYDACTMPLMAAESGLIVTLPGGDPFDAPMDLTSPVDWVMYANQDLRNLVEPELNKLLLREGLL